MDPLLHEDDYLGLEGDLRVAEQLVEEANQQYADEAQRLWDIAETRDMDNIEAGVERLGDFIDYCLSVFLLLGLCVMRGGWDFISVWICWSM